jgi:pantetheine-phosphate adenylyltransferase
LAAVFPGTFDPITIGHMDIIKRFRRAWPEETLIIAVADGNNTQKNPLFSLEERFTQVKTLTAQIDHLEVEAFSGLVVKFAEKKGARFLIRGLRNGTDFNYEMEMALFNRLLAPEIETLFIPAAAEHTIVSSSAVRQIAALGGNADWMVPENVQRDLRAKLTQIT